MGSLIFLIESDLIAYAIYMEEQWARLFHSSTSPVIFRGSLPRLQISMSVFVSVSTNRHSYQGYLNIPELQTPSLLLNFITSEPQPLNIIPDDSLSLVLLDHSIAGCWISSMAINARPYPLTSPTRICKYGPQIQPLPVRHKISINYPFILTDTSFPPPLLYP